MENNHRKPRFVNRPNDRGMNASTTPRKFNFDGKIVILLLLFFSFFPLASADVWIEAIVFAVIFALSGLYIWLNEPEIESRQMLKPLFILAGYSFFQGSATIVSQSGVLHFPGFLFESFDPVASFWSAFKILGFALFISLLLKTFRRHVGFLTRGLILTGIFFALFGIGRYQWQADFPSFFGNVISPRLAVGVGFGTYFNQNHFAYLMLMTLGLTSALFLYDKKSKGTRLFLLAAGLTTWCALILTGSRGGIIGSFAEIAVLLIAPFIVNARNGISNDRKILRSRILFIVRQATILLLITGFLVIGIILIGQDRVVGRFEEIPGQLGGVTNAATFRRTDVWRAAIKIIEEYPMSGIGFGGFHVAVSQYIDISGQLQPAQVHNDYLELAASGGMIALALAALFLYRFSSLVKKRFSEPSNSFSRACRIGAVCGIAGVALHSFFDFGLQITPNLLFFAALMCIAVHKPFYKNQPDSISTAPKNSLPFKFAGSILYLTLAGVASLFGYARNQLEAAKIIPGAAAAENQIYKIPFDSAYYETKAGIFEDSGRTEAAANAMQSAIRYRPKDYGLWLSLGRLEQIQGRLPEAENAFRRAVELAPRYGKPHFYYGNFLLKANRKASGFAELRFASVRNPVYFAEVVDRVWLETSGNAGELIDVLSPLETAEREHLISFLFERDEFAAIVQLGCREENLTPVSRDALTRKMLEKKHYHFAEKIHKQDCETSGSAAGGIEDGGFENGKVTEGIGFGWRAPPLSGTTRIGFDKTEAASGRSLRIDFGGQETAPVLLSQTLVVEKGRKYQLQFSSRTSGLITGKLPLLQVILLQSDSEKVISETKLSLEESEWVRFSIEFETGERAEAVEIRLARPICPESLCPIYGRLWLDDFVLRSRN